MKLKKLVEQLPGCEVHGDAEVEIKGIAAHSRQVEKGWLFAALEGRERLGMDFVSEAIDRGAAALLLKEFFPLANGRLVQIKVGDPRWALAVAANEFYQHPSRKMEVAGVTGTNGKTTVAILSSALLQAGGIPTGLLGTIYYQIGQRTLPSDLTTPAPPYLQYLLEEMRKTGCRRVVMEVSSHALDQNRVEGIEFSTVVFTNLTSEHLDYHHSLEEYGRAKLKLFTRPAPSGSPVSSARTAIINFDDPFGRRIAESVSGRVISYGFSPGVSLRADGIELGPGGSRFLLDRQGKVDPVEITLLGRHNVLNTLAAIALGLEAGLSLETILPALKGFGGIPGRLEQVQAGQDFHVLIDYAHTPDALENSLRTVREIFPRRVIVVFGCGGDRDRSKRPRMGEAAEREADMVILTSDNPRSEDPEAIIAEIKAGMRERVGNVLSIPSRRVAMEEAFSLAASDDVVLIAGKGHEQQQIFRDRVVPFNDRLVALDILGGRKR